MNFYEMVYIARGELGQPQVNALNTELSNIITAAGGKVTKVEHWGLKNFAYRIKKRNKGHYCLLNLEANKEILKILNDKTKHHESILRILLTKVNTLDNSPSIMMTKPATSKFDRKDPKEIRPTPEIEEVKAEEVSIEE